MVRDRVVIGCYSQKVREKLIQEGSELTLEKAVDIARTQEMSNTQLQSMAPEKKNVNSLREERDLTILQECANPSSRKEKGTSMESKKMRVVMMICMLVLLDPHSR